MGEGLVGVGGWTGCFAERRMRICAVDGCIFGIFGGTEYALDFDTERGIVRETRKQVRLLIGGIQNGVPAQLGRLGWAERELQQGAGVLIRRNLSGRRKDFIFVIYASCLLKKLEQFRGRGIAVVLNDVIQQSSTIIAVGSVGVGAGDDDAVLIHFFHDGGLGRSGAIGDAG